MRTTATIFLAAGVAVGGLPPAGCAPGSDGEGNRPDAGDVRNDDAGVPEATDGPQCDSGAQCDDRIDCTDDFCNAAGLCEHVPVDRRCPDGQRCMVSSGCEERCSVHADCDDRQWCNGTETCGGGWCFPGDPRDCGDGNPCTEDRCDEETDLCVRTRLDIEGCEQDGGGDVVTPFDPAVHYSGEFHLRPIQSSSCLRATYSISTVRFRTAGDSLEVSGPPCTMAGSPVPSGPEFSVWCVDPGCGRYELTGSFSDADNFEARWTATFVAPGCGICSRQDATVYGMRI